MLSRLWSGLTALMGAARARPPRCTEGDPERVRAAEAVLERLRPGLRADGGDVELLAVEPDGSLRLAFRGACVDCGARSLTLRAGLEPALAAELDWFSGIHEVN